MGNINIKIKGQVKTMSGEIKNDVELDLKVTASDLSPLDHDVIGYNGNAYPPNVAVEDRKEPIRIEGIHSDASGPMGVRHDFGGMIKSTDFDYDVKKVGNKSELTSASQSSLAGVIIGQLAEALSLDPSTDFEVL